MRYVLLGTTILGASAMLPMVQMSDAPSGQPVEQVEISVLDAPDAAAAAAPVPAGLSLDMPSVGLASFLPTRAITEFLTPDAPEAVAEAADEAPASPVPEIVLAAADSADLPPMGGLPAFEGADLDAALVESFAVGENDDAAVLAEIVAEAIDAPAPVKPAGPVETAEAMPEIPVPALGALDLAPGGIVGSASLFPFEALTNFFSRDDEAAPDAPAVETAIRAPGAPILPSDRPNVTLTPLSEDVGSLILGTDSEVSLSLVSFEPEPAKVETVAVAAPPAAPEPAPEPAPEAVAEAAPPETGDDGAMVRVTASFLNLRAGPSSRHSVVVGLTRGAQAELIEDPGNGWVQIRVAGTGQEGWVFGRYLTETGA